MNSVAIVDAHLILRTALASVINNFSGFHVMYSATDGVDLIHRIENEGPPDILLLDLEMDGMGGYDTARWLKEHYPNTRILILSTHTSEMMMIRLLKAGVRGFMDKDVHPDDLRKAMHRVLQKNGYYLYGDGNEQLGVLFQFIQATTSKDGSSSLLTDKEIEFVKLCCNDENFKVIAGKMHISYRTLITLKEGVLGKLELKTRAGLVAYAMKSGIMYL